MKALEAQRDPYCPVCSPDEESAGQLCETHFIARWAFTPAEQDATTRLAECVFGGVVAPLAGVAA